MSEGRPPADAPRGFVYFSERVHELSGRIIAPRYRRVLRLFGFVLSLASAVFVIWFVEKQWTQLQDLHFSGGTALAFGAAVAIYLLVALSVALGWRELMRALGAKLSPHLAFVLVWRTQIAKYLPSNLVQYGGRVFLARMYGVRIPVTGGTLVLEIGLSAIACLLLSTPLMFRAFWLSMVWVGGLLGALGVLGAILAIYWRSLPKAERANLAWKLWRDLSFAFLCYAVVVVLLALGLFFLLGALDPDEVHWSLFPRLLSATALAWVAGMAAVGAPAGLGVREAVLLVALQGHYSGAALATAVILHRISTTVGDCLAFALTFVRPPRPLPVGASGERTAG